MARSRVGPIRLRSSSGRAPRCPPGTRALGSASRADRVSAAAGCGPALPSLFRTASHLLWPRTHPGRQSHRLLRVLARHTSSCLTAGATPSRGSAGARAGGDYDADFAERRACRRAPARASRSAPSFIQRLRMFRGRTSLIRSSGLGYHGWLDVVKQGGEKLSSFTAYR
jgi:hypothetical protein